MKVGGGQASGFAVTRRPAPGRVNPALREGMRNEQASFPHYYFETGNHYCIVLRK